MSKIAVNGIQFTEIPNETFVIYGEEDLVPFMESFYHDCDPHNPLSKTGNFPYRKYRAMVFEGKFYGPKINKL